ncbi:MULTISPECIES: glycoside-pentoside-hexuronide (GPH):cation symporter [Gammaproteobacteria]|uniref:glycoside-pentoside-hexuronide (GPH):cation symporter n=1 Tax=Gammaproteobacteria TaxID=1236 RepID=UPI000DD095FB|nr:MULTISPECIES: glycoside-pentoside-hexuronide (GPH):cation symporter [Gammaproteobacteria]RTE86291.1 MFS transporter [Aliidiomarina sp. B3213]TCZ91642.1 MFS transporter [Lysobacter sp. N42]
MISRKEKVAYGLGDTASNLIFQTVMLFLAFFYTDIFGISAAAVGTMFLVVRLIDAVTDPLMGLLADKTQTRFGQFRPYLIWLVIPFAVFSILAFTTPGLSGSGKLVYAYVTYTLLMLAYTAINIPYSALGAAITQDPEERVSVQSYRFVFGMLGGLIVTLCTLPLVEALGNGNRALGYQLTIAFMSVLGVIFFLICFAGTKERTQPNHSQNLTLKSGLQVLWKNDALKTLAIVAVLLLTGIAIKNTLAIYYVKYYLMRDDLVTEFVSIGMVGNILGCAIANPLTRRVDKVIAYKALQLIAAALSLLAFWVAPNQLSLAFILYFFWSFFLQMATPMLWAKIADVVDLGQKQSGIRATGLIYASVVFFIKIGIAIGGAIAGWWLALYGYQADQTQTAESQFGILVAFTVLPAICSILVAWVMRGYKLDQTRVLRISKELTQKI